MSLKCQFFGPPVETQHPFVHDNVLARHQGSGSGVLGYKTADEKFRRVLDKIWDRKKLGVGVEAARSPNF